jgi:hypothetical protein
LTEPFFFIDPKNEKTKISWDQICKFCQLFYIWKLI